MTESHLQLEPLIEIDLNRQRISGNSIKETLFSSFQGEIEFCIELLLKFILTFSYIFSHFCIDLHSQFNFIQLNLAYVNLVCFICSQITLLISFTIIFTFIQTSCILSNPLFLEGLVACTSILRILIGKIIIDRRQQVTLHG